MTKALQGINLGGWLVLERWITPSVFSDTDVNDEWSLGQSLGELPMRARLKQHRDSFITKEDIKWIAQRGFSIVRLPVGYWVFEDCDGFYGAVEYIDQLFEWVEEYKLKVIIDLHGAPGSQNGWDHSGRAGQLGWHTKVEYISQTVTVLDLLANKYGASTVLYGIEVLNEPHWDIPIDILLSFYFIAYRVLRGICRDEVGIIVSDSFRRQEVTDGLLVMGLTGVMIDSHFYQVFSNEDKQLNFKGHIKKVDAWRREMQLLAANFPVMVGEWSAALDPSTFNGRLEKEITAVTNEYFMKQQEMFNNQASVWCYWTYKTEGNSPWSYRNQQDFVLI